MFKNKDTDLTFISKIPGLTALEECLPKPTSKFVPAWWKDLKIDESVQSAYNLYTGNIKHCPSFTDLFSSGYVVPMWMDIYIGYDKNTGKSGVQSNGLTNVGYHADASKDLANYKFLGNDTSAIFKMYSPWSVITKPNVSVMVLPLFFHMNPDFSVIPGMVDTDFINHISPDLAYHSKEKEIFIERGTPLFQIIPLQKEKFSFSVKEIDELSKDTKKRYYNNVFDHQTKLVGGNFYINKRRKNG